MKNFLLFLLGFILVFALTLRYSYAFDRGLNYCSDDGRCYYMQVIVTDPNPSYTGTGTLTATNWLLNEYTCPITSSYTSTGSGYYRVTFRRWYWRTDSGVPAPVWQPLSDVVIDFKKDGLLTPSMSDAQTAIQAYPDGPPANCGQSLDCADSDSDGVCDYCDAAPNDSNAGSETYLKGYYVYNNRTVAMITSDSSSSNVNYDSVTILDFSAPGVIIGAGGGIDTDTFIENGGKFIALDNPEFIQRTTCQTVTDLTQCETVPCLYDTSSPADDLDLDPENTPAENTTRPSTEEKENELPYLNPDRTCDNRKYKCSELCDGTENIAGFACSDGYYNCECKDGGQASLVENYGDTINTEIINNSAEEIENQGNQTGNNINIGGDFSGGGTSVDSDNDGYADGYTAGERMIDFAPLVRSTSLLQTKFPFSLIAYIADLIEPWITTPTAPVFTFNLFGGHFEFDMARLDPLADFVRSMLGFLFTALCVWGIIAIFF